VKDADTTLPYYADITMPLIGHYITICRQAIIIYIDIDDAMIPYIKMPMLTLFICSLFILHYAFIRRLAAAAIRHYYATPPPRQLSRYYVKRHFYTPYIFTPHLRCRLHDAAFHITITLSFLMSLQVFRFIAAI